MYKLIIFDFDGPILDSFKVGRESISLARKRLIAEGLIVAEKLPELSEKSIIANWGYPGPIAIKKLFPELNEKEVAALGVVWGQTQQDKEIPFVEKTAETLKYLKDSGYAIGLLTSRVFNLDYHLEKGKLFEYFNFIQSWLYPEIKNQKPIRENHFLEVAFKPNPEVFEKVLLWVKQNSIKKEEILMIDDSLVGLNAARGANIEFLGVLTGPMASKEKWQEYGNLGPECVINSIADLPSWLENQKRV
ncbi:MAG: HAD family hydrolase [Candidatus Nealsonbacteria bacterium]|nr:HAD family hydrolase [Candidatus Nealsonbacteria bacterium]